MTDIHLHINNLSHYYGSSSQTIPTLRSINLSLIRGELLGILGPSGCGKTTLLRLIAGLESPSQGNICIENRIVSSPEHVLPTERRGIGMVFQDYALFPHLNVWRNVCFGLSTNSDKAKANWLLELVGLIDLRDSYPHQLSGGQKQRLALARALAPGTSLLLLDEPFCSLDVEVRHNLRNVLTSVLRSCSATAILVTHDPHEALGICDRVAVLKDGSLHQCSSPVDMLQKPLTSFVGKFVFQNNIVNIHSNGNSFNTPYGSIIAQSHLFKSQPNVLMFDENSLSISLNPCGKCTIISKEFRASQWICRIQDSQNILRVSVTLDANIKIGDKCDLKFINGKYAFLYPGCVSCILKANN